MDLALAQIEKGLLPSTAERDAVQRQATPALVPQTQRSSGTCLETGNYTTGGVRIRVRVRVRGGVEGGCTKHDSFKRPAAQAHMYNSLWRLNKD